MASAPGTLLSQSNLPRWAPQFQNNSGQGTFIQGGVQAGRDVNFYGAQEDEKEKIESWLSTWESQKSHENRRSELCDTGFEFLESAAYEDWVHGNSCCLHLYGGRGSGKTMLCTALIDSLTRNYEDLHDTQTRVLYVYLEDRVVEADQTARKETFLCDLLKQIVQKSDFVPPSIRGLYKIKQKRKEHLDWNEVCDLWRTQAAKYQKVFLVVDGLDRIPGSLASDILGELSREESFNLRLLFTSRDPDFGRLDRLRGIPDDHKLHDIFYSPSHMEINSYIRQKFEHILLPDGMQDFVFDTTAARCGNNYILADLFMRYIPADEAPATILECLAEFPDTVERFHREALEDIKHQQHLRDQELGLKILFYVSKAKRELTIAELLHLIAIEPEEETARINRDRLKQPQKLRSVTSYLVSVDDISNENCAVRFFNESARAFLMSYDLKSEYKRVARINAGGLEFSLLCLTYLHYDMFQKPSDDLDALEKRLEEHPFASYAAQYWGDHLNDAMEEHPQTGTRIEKLAMELLSDDGKAAACTQIAWFKNAFQMGGMDVRKSMTSLHLCAYYGLPSFIPLLAATFPANINAREHTYGQTPLHYACRRGHLKTVQALLSCGADVNLVSARGRSALFEAIDPQLCTASTIGATMALSVDSTANVNTDVQDEILRSLLADTSASMYAQIPLALAWCAVPDRKVNSGVYRNIKVNEIDHGYYDRTPLILAVELGRYEMVKSLLAHPNIAINQRDVLGCTALWHAATRGLEDITKVLLDQPGVEINTKDIRTHKTPLICAAENDSGDVVAMLLAQSANASYQMPLNGKSALLRAAELGKSHALKVLLDRLKLDGSAIHACDNEGNGLFHLAAGKGGLNVLQMVTEQQLGLDINLKDKYGMTCLHHACRAAVVDLSVLSILVEDCGASVSAEDNIGRTPLIVAWQYGKEEACDFLATKTTPILGTALADDVSLALWSLLQRWEIDRAIQMVTIDNTSTFEDEPSTGNSVLHLAVKLRQPELLKALLLHANSTPNVSNHIGRTPLHQAAWTGDEDSIALLLEHSAEIDAKDIWGDTPLSIALAQKQLQTAVLLFDRGADVDEIKYVKNIKIQTLFFAAVESKHPQAIQRLLRLGADALGRNPRGQTAIDLVHAAGENKELLKMLMTAKSFTYSDAALAAVGTSEDVVAHPGPMRNHILWNFGAPLLKAITDFTLSNDTTSNEAPRIEDACIPWENNM
ncbi:MAG: hypothetical protein Q9157_001663 [Trypethelium eluteriae]